MMRFGIVVCLSVVALAGSAFALDVVTLTGRKITNIHEIVVQADGYTFSTDKGLEKVKAVELTEASLVALEDKTGKRRPGGAKPAAVSVPPAAATQVPKPVGAAPSPAGTPSAPGPVIGSLAAIPTGPPPGALASAFEERVKAGSALTKKGMAVTLALGNAYRLWDLERAKGRASKEGKLIGLILVEDDFFDKPVRTHEPTASGGFAHFFGTFNEALVLVFVQKPGELEKVPPAAKQAFTGAAAPHMVVLTADAAKFVCDISGGGEKSTGAARDPIFAKGAAAIADYLRRTNAIR